MPNRDLILAGVAGGGSGASLAWFAPKGTQMPTSADAELDPAFLDPGYITEDGLAKAVSEDSTDIPAYGMSVPVRTLITSSKVTFQLAFLESNPVSLAIYNRLPLDGITVDATKGSLDFTEGTARTIEYAAVFDIADGANLIRGCVPDLQVTDREDYSIKAGEAITQGVTCTAYPGSDGVAVHWFYVLNALKTTTP